MSDTPHIWNIGENICIDLLVLNPSTGYGLTGQTAYITLLIRQASSGYYWNGTAWVVAATTISMIEADATNEPGRYTYILPGTTGNTAANKYYTFARINNPVVLEGDASSVHVSKDQDVRIYESEPL